LVTTSTKTKIIAAFRGLAIILPLVFLSIRYGLSAAEFNHLFTVTHSFVGVLFYLIPLPLVGLAGLAVIKFVDPDKPERRDAIMFWAGVFAVVVMFLALTAYVKITTP
jgi:hypothetical protein